MYIVRFCIGTAFGLIAGFLLLNILAVLFYALPRAVLNAARGLVRWKVSGFYLVGAGAYAAILVVVTFSAYWLAADRNGLIFGFAMTKVAKLATIRQLQSDVDQRLTNYLAADSDRKELPTWANRGRSPREI